MLDIERAVIDYLGSNLASGVYAEVPNPRPLRFVTVERTGGATAEHGALDRPMVAVQSWDQTRFGASTLSQTVDLLMAQMPDEVENVFDCDCDGIYNFPDPDSGQPRYQAIYDLVTT